jgi:hypothetical protein
MIYLFIAIIFLSFLTLFFIFRTAFNDDDSFTNELIFIISSLFFIVELTVIFQLVSGISTSFFW